MSRKLDEILDAAVEVMVKPPEDSVEMLCRAALTTAISTVCGIYERTAKLPSPGKMKGRMANHLKALRAARKTANAVAPFYWSKAFGRLRPDDDRADRVPPPPYSFIEALDREIREVETRALFPVPHGARPRDLTADMAAAAARGLLKVRFIFPKDRDGKDLPAVKNPWQQDAPLTEGGPLLVLAALIYEAVTGKDNHDMMPACRDADKLLLRLPYSSTPRSRRPKSRRATDARR